MLPFLSESGKKRYWEDVYDYMFIYIFVCSVTKLFNLLFFLGWQDESDSLISYLKKQGTYIKKRILKDKVSNYSTRSWELERVY